MHFNLSPILDSIYYIGFLGTPNQLQECADFLNNLENDLLTSNDSKTMLDLIRNCKLRSGVLPSDAPLTFGWESRVDWWRRFERAGTVVIVVTSILGALVSLKVI